MPWLPLRNALGHSLTQPCRAFASARRSPSIARTIGGRMAALSRAHRFTPRSSAGSSILSLSEQKAARAYNSRILRHAGTAPLSSTPGGRGARPIIAGPTDNLQLLGVGKSRPEAKVHPDRHSALIDLNAAGAGGLRAPAGSRRLADSGLDPTMPRHTPTG